MAALLPVEKDGVFDLSYYVYISRKPRLFKGRKIVYLIEVEDNKRLLTNNGDGSAHCLFLHSVQFDIKVTKMVNGYPKSSCRILGSNKNHKTLCLRFDVPSEENSVIKILSCNNDTVQLIED